MERSLRHRVLDRFAGVTLAVPAVVPLWFAIQAGALSFSALAQVGTCEELCALFTIGGVLAFLLGLTMLGLGVAVWMGSRLGRLVGLAVALGGSVLSGSSVAGLFDGGFRMSDEEVLTVLRPGLSFAIASILLLLSLREWLVVALEERR